MTTAKNKPKTAKQKKLDAKRRRKEVIPPIDPTKGKKAHDLDLLEQIMNEELEAYPEKQRKPLIHYMQQYLSGQCKLDLDDYHTIPVDPKTFLIDDYYLGLKDDVYPALIDEFVEMNSGKYIEIVLTGGIGTGKTTLAVWNTAYQLYLLSCLKNPHKLFKLDKSSEILIVFQSITADLARKLNYNRFKALIDQSPYFQTKFPYDRRVETELKYPNRIYIRPVSGEDTAAIGQNVIGGIIDEINYMAVTSNSKKEEGGGTYDQAAKVYNSIARRRKSRFMTKGQIAGLLCLVSSRKYPGQFTDRKEEEAKKDKTIYIYDKTIWMIKPKGTYGDKRFKVFIGDATRKPRILDEGEDPRKTYKPQDQSMIRSIPVEFKNEFQTDMVNALREVAGVATLATHPFILNTDAIEPCFDPKYKSVFAEQICNFDDKKLHILKNNIVAPDIPRFIHLDLSLTGDATGFAMGHVSRFRTIDRGDTKEIHPVFKIDGALAIEAPVGG